jgi:ferritin
LASWTETKGLSGSSSFLYQHSDEERQHMLKLVKFINERGGKSLVPALIQPPKTFKSLTHVFESLLEHELNVTESINNIVGLCLDEKDFTTHNFMLSVTFNSCSSKHSKTWIKDLKVLGG